MGCATDDPVITLAGLLFEVHDGLTSSLGTARDPSNEVLIRLARSPGEQLRMTDLAAQVTMSPSGLSRAVDRLVGGGLIERGACTTDRRVVYARLTAAGRAALEALLPEHVQRLEEAFAVLAPDERAAFEGALRKLRERVNPAAVAASDPDRLSISS